MQLTEAACPHLESDAAPRHVAYTLPAGEAERFEEHVFACEACWREVQQGAAIRLALARRPRARFLPLAAAAALLIAVVALVPWIRPDGADRMRGSSQAIEVRTSHRNGELRIEWSPVAGAVRYRVTLNEADGTLVLRKETTATSMVVKAGRSVMVTVAAISKEGEEIARSKPRRIATIPSDARPASVDRDRSPGHERLGGREGDRIASRPGRPPLLTRS